jgi:predicted Mrr-cat superfamily restriction endonuclease
MTKSILEITANDYCIKLNKESFSISLVKQLIAKIQAEEMMLNKGGNDLEEDIISRNANYHFANFDRLDEK